VNSCVVEPQSYDASTKKTLGQTLIDKHFNDANLHGMKTPDQLELESALLIEAHAYIHAANNCPNFQDWEAASVAILAKTIELITKKEIEICFKKNASTSSN